MLWPALFALPPVVLLAACSAPPTDVDPAGAHARGEATPGSLGPAPAAPSLADHGGPQHSAHRSAQTFDAVWTIVRDTHFDPSHLDAATGGVDWLAVRDELRPAAIAAETPDQLRGELDAMLERLGQSHFAIVAGDSIPSSAGASPTSIGHSPALDQALSSAPAAAGSLGIDVRIIDGAAIVTGLVGGLPGESSGVQKGWEVVAVDGRLVSSELALDAAKATFDSAGRGASRQALRPTSWRLLLESQRVVEMLDGQLGESRTVRFLTADGASVERRLWLWPTPGMLVQLGDLPPLHARLTSRQANGRELVAAGARGTVVETEGGVGSGAEPSSATLQIGVIAFNVWMPPMARAFHQAVDRFRDADGIVVDLRGNAGGVGGMATTLAAHFTRERISLGTLRTRSESLEFTVNPCYATAEAELTEPFEGPLAILVDELSASTSEIFAGGLQRAGRARIFGAATAGATLPARTSRLPNGDTLVHAVADFSLADGTRLEANGVVPDELVPLRRADLLAERDEALLAALRWIAASPRSTDPLTPRRALLERRASLVPRASLDRRAAFDRQAILTTSHLDSPSRVPPATNHLPSP